MGYGGVWVGALVDTWNGGPPPLKPTPMGYGGAWVGGHEFGLAIESLPCHLLARPTPGFKPTPIGATPNPSPWGGGLGVFSQPTPQPKPHTPWP
ncbi:hypothetical protein HanIR_Chr12g0604981 [Helianthus annuus]|nr:hypothetical protein HanIR_Chr12g0604981 [Helianthus annuus]